MRSILCFSWFVHANSRIESKWFNVNNSTCLGPLVESICILTEVSIKPINLSILDSFNRIIEEWTAQCINLFKITLLTDVGANKNGQSNAVAIISFITEMNNLILYLFKTIGIVCIVLSNFNFKLLYLNEQ